MKRRYLVALAAGGALLLGGGTALAASYPTTITHDNRTPVGANKYLDSGRVSSPKRICEVLRVVKVVVRDAYDPYEERPRVVDYDLTSYFGAWATKANFAGVTSARARVTRRVIRRGGRRVKCRPASVALF